MLTALEEALALSATALAGVEVRVIVLVAREEEEGVAVGVEKVVMGEVRRAAVAVWLYLKSGVKRVQESGEASRSVWPGEGRTLGHLRRERRNQTFHRGRRRTRLLRKFPAILRC